MSEALVIVVLFASNPDPTADTLVSATQQALGSETLILAKSSGAQSDDASLAIGERLHSWAIIRVSWADHAFLKAKLHVHVATSSAWEDDEIQFARRDAVAERGRTLGYAVASMVQRMARAAPPDQIPEALAEKDARPRPAPASVAVPDTDGEVEAESVMRPITSVDRPPEPVPANRPRHELFVLGTGVLGGAATSGGASGGVRWWPLESVGLRGTIGGRSGEVGEANASVTTLFLGGGAAYRRQVSPTLELGVRSDILLLQHTVRRTEGGEMTHARFIGGVDSMMEGSWAVTPELSVIAGAGGEIAFGSTVIRVGGQPTAEIPIARAVTELGLRFQF